MIPRFPSLNSLARQP